MLRKLLLILLLLPTTVIAADFIEGKDYQLITTAKDKQTQTAKPIVTEFFSYGCPWCFKLEAPLDGWAAARVKSVQLEKVPVVFRPEWELYAKAFYTAKMLNMSDKLTPMLFKAIQENRQALNTKQAMIDFFVAQGVDTELAKSAFENSPTIDLRVNNGTNLMANYQISAVPAFVVNSRYKTDLQMAGDQQRLFEILDYLVKKNG